MSRQLQEYLGVFAALVAIWASAWYIKTIIKGTTQPHPVTWLVWTLVGAIGTYAAFQEGAGTGALVALVYLCMQAICFCLSMRKKYRKEHMGRFDIPLGIGAVVFLVLWLVIGWPAVVAALVAVVADAMGLWPTLSSVRRDPASEAFGPWALGSVAALLAIPAIAEQNVASMAYPVYLVIAEAAVAGAILLGNRTSRR